MLQSSLGRRSYIHPKMITFAAQTFTSVPHPLSLQPGKTSGAVYVRVPKDALRTLFGDSRTLERPATSHISRGLTYPETSMPRTDVITKLLRLSRADGSDAVLADDIITLHV